MVNGENDCELLLLIVECMTNLFWVEGDRRVIVKFCAKLYQMSNTFLFDCFLAMKLNGNVGLTPVPEECLWGALRS